MSIEGLKIEGLKMKPINKAANFVHKEWDWDYYKNLILVYWTFLSFYM